MKLMQITKSTRVIVYDNKPGMSYMAARGYWMFRVFGHTNVSIINGGFKKWVAEGRPVEKSEEKEDDYKYTLNKDLVKTYEQICALEGKKAEV
jgi:thiosulfate/3-mercaptopyruvate sulfurtransferase